MKTSYINLGVIFLKLGSTLLKVVKSAKVIKTGLIVGSIGAYSYLFTWQMGIALTAMLIVHEYGHVWAMKRKGMKVKGMYLIPFLGAVAVPDEDFPTREVESYSAIMGPIWGGIFSLAMLILYFITQNTIFAGIASFMAFINLFNLFPVNPLDGGRILKSIFLSIHNTIGIGIFTIISFLAIGVSIFQGYSLLVLVLILGVFELIGEYIIIKSLEKNLGGKESIKWIKQWKAIKYYTGKDPVKEYLKDNYYGTELSDKLATIEEFEENTKAIKPDMTTKELITYTTAYLFVAIFLIAIIVYADNIPGADLALKMLKGE